MKGRTLLLSVLVVLAYIAALSLILFVRPTEREVDDLSDRVSALGPAVSIMSDLAVHGLGLEVKLLDVCSEKLGEPDPVCEAFISKLESREFAPDTDNPAALNYIQTTKASDQLLVEGWRENDLAKWREGIDLLQVSLGLLATTLGPDRN